MPLQSSVKMVKRLVPKTICRDSSAPDGQQYKHANKRLGRKEVFTVELL